jgi:hypothetical protein
MPADVGIDQPQRAWHPHVLPTCDQQDQREAKQIGGILTVAGDMAHGMLPAPLRFERTVPKEIEHAIGWRWQRPQRRGGPISQDRRRILWARPDHPQRGPVCECGWQVRFEPFERPLAGIAEQGHQPPTADEKVRPLGAAKVPLEWGEHWVYLAGEACGTPHVSRSFVFGDVGCIQNTQERFFVQASCGDTHITEVCSPVIFEVIECQQDGLYRKSYFRKSQKDGPQLIRAS